MQVFLQTLAGGLSLGAIYAMVATGFSLVYRTMGLVNFAHADVLMIGAYVAATFYMSLRLPFVLAMTLAIGITALVGLVIERVLRPLENTDVTLMLIGTIGFGMVLEAVATLIWGATGRAVASPVAAAPLRLGAVRIRSYDLLIVAVAAAAVALLTWFLRHTKRGAAMQAVAMDHQAATAVGIHVGRSNALAFAIGAALASLAGGLAGPMLYVSPTMGATLGIKGFAAAMLGGCGNLGGAIIGGLVIGVLDSFAAIEFQGYSELVVFLVFTVLIMCKPTGILGETTVSRA